MLCLHQLSLSSLGLCRASLQPGPRGGRHRTTSLPSRAPSGASLLYPISGNSTGAGRSQGGRGVHGSFGATAVAGGIRGCGLVESRGGRRGAAPPAASAGGERSPRTLRSCTSSGAPRCSSRTRSLEFQRCADEWTVEDVQHGGVLHIFSAHQAGKPRPSLAMA